MSKAFGIHGSTTDHGGMVISTQARSSQMGNLFLRAGDGFACPKCKIWSTLIQSNSHIIFDGKPVAYVGDKFTCGATLMPKQMHVVGDSGGSNYRNSTVSILQPVNSQQNLTNSLVDNDKELLNGYYYNIETGLYEGNISTGKGNKEDVYACTGKVSDIEFLSPKNANITHQKFQECCRVVSHESGTATVECIYIAFTANNYAKQVKKDLHSLLMSGYSTMPTGTKTPLPDKSTDEKPENLKFGLARKGVLKVCLGDEDPTDGATHWDGTDFLAWGLESPYKNKDHSNKPHAKFREYKKITISKDIYDEFLAGALKEYPKGRVRYSGIFYDIPAKVFKDRKNWLSGNFEYTTGSKSSKSLSAKVTAGHTIFWKAS